MAVSALNVFEGSRRLALIAKVILAGGLLLLVAFQAPYVSLRYETVSPSAPFTKGGDCRIGTDAYESLSRSVGETEVSVFLCFKAATATDGRQLIPYKTENDQWWGNTRYANEVMSYTKARAEGFQIPQIDLSDVSHQFWYQRGRNAGYALTVAIACWLILSVLQALIGWVVRGFLGIPRGMDRRPQAEQIANSRAVADGEDSLRAG